MADIRQDPLWAQYMQETGWNVSKVSGNYAYWKRLPFYGTRFRIPRFSFPNDPSLITIALEEIDALAKKHRALFIKITPNILLDDPYSMPIDQLLLKQGYKKDFATNTISKTSVINLRLNEKTLSKNLHLKTRQHIKRAKKNGVEVYESNDIDLCYSLYTETSRRHGFRGESYHAIRTRYKLFQKEKRVLLLFASVRDKPVATLLLLGDRKKHTVFSNVAGTSDTQRNMKANHLLLWKSILLAKKRGYHRFDFDGIEDKRFRNHKLWENATFFKNGFGGDELTFLGSYIKSYHPILTLFFALVSKR
ncbi:MAG: peptidoglycan bridge formation glycyltransferase FemA/FemB family protein [bacterium]|nr:peptidoglycan bridge formation glycyltransferase FemA/FemB family protein [bacterium]